MGETKCFNYRNNAETISGVKADVEVVGQVKAHRAAVAFLYVHVGHRQRAYRVHQKKEALGFLVV